MKELKFLNFIFNSKDWNYTVRLGPTYYDEGKLGDKFLLVPVKPSLDTMANGCLIATVRELVKGHFSCIPQYVYTKEHDPACRTEEGLIEAMRAAYGQAFNPEDDPVVSCIAFKLD